ncbi:hypothetical protein OH77DRAFT_1090170 [Trametes cingulata]|nr:hypothetical protein OH77DRAFT_1090170 [Trametes cingulata]
MSEMSREALVQIGGTCRRLCHWPQRQDGTIALVGHWPSLPRIPACCVYLSSRRAGCLQKESAQKTRPPTLSRKPLVPLRVSEHRLEPEPVPKKPKRTSSKVTSSRSSKGKAVNDQPESNPKEVCGAPNSGIVSLSQLRSPQGRPPAATVPLAALQSLDRRRPLYQNHTARRVHGSCSRHTRTRIARER